MTHRFSTCSRVPPHLLSPSHRDVDELPHRSNPFSWVTLLLVLVCFLPGCQPKPIVADEVRIGMRRPPDSFNPYLSTSEEGEFIAARLFPKLFREEPTTAAGLPQLTPILVESFSWTEEATTLTLVLKSGLTWSDGTRLTTADVAYSFSLQKNEQLPWLPAGSKASLQSWEVTSPTQMTVRFAHPSPFQLLNLNEGFIVPKHTYESVPIEAWPEHDWANQTVVFGPYRIGKYRAGEQLSLEPLDAKHPRLGFAFVRDKESLFQLVSAGDLDYAWSLPVERIKDIRERLQPVIFSDLSFLFIGWNPLHPQASPEGGFPSKEELRLALSQTPHPIFGDARVRKALTLVLNRSSYLQRFWSGYGRVPVSPWSAGLPFYKPEQSPSDPQLDEAARLLTEAGWQKAGEFWEKNGAPFQFTIICNAGSHIREQYLLAIRHDLAQFGVTMELNLTEPGLYFSLCQQRRFDAMIGGFRAGTRPDLASLFGPQASLDGGYNFSSWLGGEGLFEEVAQAQTDEQLRAALANLDRQFWADQPISLLYSGSRIGASSRPQLKPRANYLDPLYQVETWLEP